MVASRRVHAAEQKGERGRTGSNGKYSHSMRSLRHRGDVKYDERMRLARRGGTCVPHQRHMYYKWSLWF